MKKRFDGRLANELRKISIIPNVNPYAEGSVEVSFGNTRLLVTVSVEREVPPWMKEDKGAWITAEYGMLPRSTHTRSRREAAAGKQSGRTLEIQRLIGRSLRAAINLQSLPSITFKLDCDVFCADGGTRTAAISGAWVALFQAIRWCEREKLISENIPMIPIAAISVGAVNGEYLLDLAYEEDSTAEFDLNVVCNEQQQIIEIQGTAEHRPINRLEMDQLINLASDGIQTIIDHQRQAIKKLS